MEQLIQLDSFTRLPLLRTKLMMPRARTNCVVRQGLLDKLNQAIAADGSIRPKLTLITAPAGYGKTTATTQWVQQLNRPVAWVSLDESDNDIGRFLAYFFSAIRLANEPLVVEVMGRLTSGYAYNSVDAMLTTLINDLTVSPHCLVVVLDDYHLIENDAIHNAVNFLLENAPDNFHLIISSRSEPALPIATLRGQGDLQMMTERDLRLSLDECRQFVGSTMGVPLPSDQVTQLDEHTEGWVTGLQLATLALQDGVDVGQAFSGSQRYLVDYLAEQVLAQQSAETQTFLLRSAILKQFNADLCTAVTGNADSQRLLEALEASHLFVVPLDAERGWYRYHHLFGDFLLGRLQARVGEAEIQRLHTQAAHWYHEQGLASEAIEHALAAGEFIFSAELLQDIARSILMYGEGALLRQWLESLPDELLANNPQLGLIYGWTLVRTGDVWEAYKLTESLAPQLDSVSPLRGEWAALRARVSEYKGWTEKNVKFSNKALAHLNLDQHGLRSEVAINLGFSHLDQSDLVAAEAAFLRAAQPDVQTPDLWAKMFATFYLGQTHLQKGHLKQALAVYEQGLANAHAFCHNRQRVSPAAGFMHVGMGEVLLLQNRLDEAKHHLDIALDMGRRGGDRKVLGYAFANLIKFHIVDGDSAAATRMADLEAARFDDRRPSFWRARVALRNNEPDILHRWEADRQIGVTDSAEKVSNDPSRYLTLAMWRTQQGRFDGLPNLFDKIIDYAKQRKNTNYYLFVLVQKAIMLHKKGVDGAAAEAFQRALTLAEPHGYIRIFLDGDRVALTQLLNQAARGGISAEYAQTLLNTHTGQHQPDELPVLASPLSPRELETLNLLALGLTNRQIGQRMVVSINTVKAHTRRLYGKLDVSNRSQAVARARDLNLI